MTPSSKSWRVLFTVLCLVFTAADSSAQKKTVYPEDQLSQEEMAAHLRFIASDKLLGRRTGTPGNDEAARYIAGEFKKSGLGAFQSAEGYFQRVPLVRRMPPGKGTFVLLGDTLNQSKKTVLQTDGIRQEVIRAQNVIGFFRGSDPKLRDEYVLLTAHYDHIGVGKPDGPSADSIYNGARDNGMGTVALIAAAKSFSKDPPKRSVIIAAVTGEEMGMLGSRHLAAEPPVPMGKIVFDLNIDGAGYDDTTLVTVVGFERTTADSAIKEGTERYGLMVMPWPAGQTDLFNRSDNASFAGRGVPAPTFSEGFHSFGPEITKYYHRAADQADDNFNFSYLLKFCKAFVHSARIISDMPVAPFWKPGDPYEQAGKKLYQKN